MEQPLDTIHVSFKLQENCERIRKDKNLFVDCLITKYNLDYLFIGDPY